MQETWVRSLGWEGPLEEEMATPSSILAWEIPWTGQPGRLQSMGSQRVGRDWSISHACTTIYLSTWYLTSYSHTSPLLFQKGLKAKPENWVVEETECVEIILDCEVQTQITLNPSPTPWPSVSSAGTRGKGFSAPSFSDLRWEAKTTRIKNGI